MWCRVVIFFVELVKMRVRRGYWEYEKDKGEMRGFRGGGVVEEVQRRVRVGSEGVLT